MSIRFYAPARLGHMGFACLVSLTALLTSCVSIFGPSQEELRKIEIVRTQKSIIISFLNKGLPGIALKELRKHIREHPTDADFKNLMGLTLLALKEPAEATGHFKKAIKIDDKISYRLNLASAHIEANQLGKALYQLRAIEKHTEWPDYKHPERVYHNSGLAYERQNNIRKAEKLYKKALRANPEFYISIMRIARIYENRNKLKSARRFYHRAKKLCSICFEPVGGIASTMLKSERPTSAIKVLSSFLKQKTSSKQDRKKAEQMLGNARNYARATKRYSR